MDHRESGCETCRQMKVLQNCTQQWIYVLTGFPLASDKTWDESQTFCVTVCCKFYLLFQQHM